MVGRDIETRVAWTDGLIARAMERAHAVVRYNLVTGDAQGRAQSRVVHPIGDGATGSIGTRRSAAQAGRLLRLPDVSLAHAGDIVEPVYAACTARWCAEAERERVPRLPRSAPRIPAP